MQWSSFLSLGTLLPGAKRLLFLRISHYKLFKLTIAFGVVRPWVGEGVSHHSSFPFKICSAVKMPGPF